MIHLESGVDLEQFDSEWLANFLQARQAEVMQLENQFGELITVYVFESKLPPIKLPEGYAVCGGSARNRLLQEMGESVKPARDVDIIAIFEFLPDMTLLEKLGRMLMPRDFSFGHGVQSANLSEYFDNRDFTLNEVLAVGSKLYVSEQCLFDTRDKIVRPSNFERQKFAFFVDPESEEVKYRGISPKLAMKALRLMIEFQLMYGQGQIKDVQAWQWHLEQLPLFWIAYGLNRAYERGQTVLELFYVELLKVGIPSKLEVKTGQVLSDEIHNLAWTLKTKLGFMFDNEEWNWAPSNLSEAEQDEWYLEQAQARLPNRVKGLSGRERLKF